MPTRVLKIGAHVWQWDPPPLAVFIAALIVRLAFVFGTHTETLSTNSWRWGDEGADIAINLIAGRGYVMSYGIFEDAQSFRMPGLPLFLSGLWSVFGYNLLLAKVVMAVISAGSCVLLLKITATLFDAPAARIAALVAIFFPSWVYWTGTLGGETLTIFFLLATTLSLLRPGRAKYVAAGVCLALLGLVRPVFLFYGGLLLGAIALGGERPRLRTVTMMAVPFFLLLAPWVIRNWVVHHAIVVTSTEGGLTFAESNNPQSFATDAEQVSGYIEKDPALLRQALALGEPLRDRFLYQTGIAYIADDPMGYARALLTRVGYTWRPIPRLTSGGYSLAHVLVMLVTWTPVLVLGIVGLVGGRSWRDRRQWPALLALLWVFVVTAAVRGAIRYRGPVEPFMIMYAAAGFEMVRRRFLGAA